MAEELLRLRLKKSNSQVLCPKGHKLRVIEMPDSECIILYCKKCKQYYPFPELNSVIQKEDKQ